MGRTYVPHETKQGLHFRNTVLVDGGSPGPLGQVALCELTYSTPTHVCHANPSCCQILDGSAIRCYSQMAILNDLTQGCSACLTNHMLCV